MTHENTFPYRQPTFALDDLEGQTRALHEDGFALIPGVLNSEEVRELRADVDRLQPFGFDHIDENEHYKCVFNRSRHFLSLIDQPGIVDLADALMYEQCHIIGETAWRSHPGYDGFRLHTDRIWVTLPESVFETPGFELPIYLCTAHYYLNDIPTEDYCPTYVIPGSHKSGRRPEKGETNWHGHELEPVLVQAGDVMFFRSEIWHSGSKNNSEAPRYLVQVHYSQRDIAQKFSPWPWFYSPETLAVATPRQRRLLGEHPEAAYG